MKRIKKSLPRLARLLGAAWTALLVIQSSTLASPVYVDASVAASGDGSSWASAYASLREAVDASAAGAELWIAAGRYLPDDTGDRTGVLALKANMVLLGGFTNGMDAVDKRNPTAYPTILCGDVQNDGPTSANSEQMVRFDAAGCRLDGLVFQHAYSIETTNSVLGFRPSGVVYTTTVIANCVFSNHTGRVAHLYGTPTFTNCVFNGNSGVNGGVIRINGSSSSPKFLDCTFSNNSAASGGVIYYDETVSSCNPVFERCVFSGNTASSFGGVIYYQVSSPSFNACLFTNNIAGAGGVIYCRNSEGLSGQGLLAVNCDFIDNHAIAGNGGVWVNGFALTSSSGGKAALSNCLFSGNTASGTGGVLYSAWGTAARSFDNCRFIANRATRGGFAFVNEGYAATFTFSECDFIGNLALNGSGGLFVANWVKEITLDACRLVGNSSRTSFGGALLANADQWGNMDVTVNNSLFVGNVAQTTGGALYAKAFGTKWVSLAVDQSLFIGNRAVTFSGGAIYSEHGSTVQATTRLNSCTFAWNQANNGGLGSTVRSPLSLTNCIAWGNTASSTRGNLFQFSGTVVPHLVLSHSSTDLPCGTISGSTVDNSFIRGVDSATVNAYQFVDVGGNRTGDPRFAPIVVGSLTGIGAFDRQTGETELDVGTALVPNAFVDTALVIATTNVYWIVSNTESSITVLGDPSSLSPTSGYAIHSPRLSSRTGRWTGAGWVADAAHSPCIDAGPEVWDVGAEPNPNGGRINMGFDGGTAFASQSVRPATLIHIR